MMRLEPPLPIEQCLDIISGMKHGARNCALYYLRTLFRLSDIRQMKTVGCVVDEGGNMRNHVTGANGRRLELDARAKSLIYLYLIKRFRTIDLYHLDRNVPLFPSEKSVAGIRQLPQLLWEFDRRIQQVATEDAAKMSSLAPEDKLFAECTEVRSEYVSAKPSDGRPPLWRLIHNHFFSN